MNTKIIYYLLILFGGVIAIYAKAGTSQSMYLLLLGFVCLMFGLYQLSKTIPSKKNSKDNAEDNFNEDDSNIAS